MTNNEILLVTQQHLLNGKIFQIDNQERSYETIRPFKLLQEHFKTLGYDLKTIDQSPHPENAFAVIFFEVPKGSNPYYIFCKKNKMQERMYVYAGEPPATYPLNYETSKHGDFKGILTFNSDLVDGKKYFRIDYTLPIKYGEKVELPKLEFTSKKLLCLVSSNKFSSDQHELYSERIKAIRFMEKSHLEDFDLYGGGWGKPMIHSRWASAIKLNGAIWVYWPKSVKFKLFPSYRGSIPDKAKVLPGYKFAISYENCVTPGFISEKILETMLYGSVPIYLGDPSVEKRIPSTCFIDKRKYPEYESLYEYISKMGEEEHNKRLADIEAFLNGKDVYPFTINAFIENFKTMLGIS